MAIARRLLVVDDSAVLRELLSNSLTSFGFDVIAQAADGLEAVELFTRLRPDAVLLDICMPGFDGWYALERIMAIDPSALVIMLTAEKEKGVLERCASKGARGFLHKPFAMDRLHEEIRLLLGVSTIESKRGFASDEYYDYWVKPRVSLPHKIRTVGGAPSRTGGTSEGDDDVRSAEEEESLR